MPLEGVGHVALAVSGGADSVALMRLVHAWAAGHPAPPRLSILTVDHGLRDRSAAEAAEVGRWADSLALQHAILRWSGEKPSSGIQAAARRARYGLMTAWCKAHGAGMLLTGHTRDDQAETVYMRLKRTFSPDSLAGIPVHGHWDGVPLLRPLLGLRRAELRNHLTGIGQSWIEDPSNDDVRFERVRIRAALRCEEVLADRLVALATRAGDAVRLLDRCADAWLRHNLTEHAAGYCIVPRGPFLDLPRALQRRLLHRMVVHYGGGQHRPEQPELDRLAGWAEDGPPRCTLAGAVLGRRKQAFWIAREPARIDSAPLVIGDAGRALWDGRFLIEAPAGSTVVPDRLGSGCSDAAAPAAARQSWPRVTRPQASTGTARVTFLRLGSS